MFSENIVQSQVFFQCSEGENGGDFGLGLVCDWGKFFVGNNIMWNLGLKFQYMYGQEIRNWRN